MWATTHPALIPHEAPGGPRPHPRIPASTEVKALLTPQIPLIHAQPGSAMTGLSRRRSRVRVPSLPSLEAPQTGTYCCLLRRKTASARAANGQQPVIADQAEIHKSPANGLVCHLIDNATWPGPEHCGLCRQPMTSGQLRWPRMPKAAQVAERVRLLSTGVSATS
jgi:hypothetical protein